MSKILIKTDDLGSIFNNQLEIVDLLTKKNLRLNELNKKSQEKFKDVKENFNIACKNILKIKKDMEFIQKSLGKMTQYKTTRDQINTVLITQNKNNSEIKDNNNDLEKKIECNIEDKDLNKEIIGKNVELIEKNNENEEYINKNKQEIENESPENNGIANDLINQEKSIQILNEIESNHINHEDPEKIQNFEEIKIEESPENNETN